MASRQWIYVNSWHMNERESAAMWKLYARTNEAVAIQSTYTRLHECLPSNAEIGKVYTPDHSGKQPYLASEVYVGEVRYIDYEREDIPEDNFFHVFMHKRKSFEHERELRALAQCMPAIQKPGGDGATTLAENPDPGGPIEVSVDELLEAVYVAPTAPVWFRDIVEAVTRKYGFSHKPVIRSSLDEVPIL